MGLHHKDVLREILGEPNSQREVPDMDFIKSAKATGIHFSDTTQHNEIHETPDSKSGANDGSGAKGWVCAAKY